MTAGQWSREEGSFNFLWVHSPQVQYHCTGKGQYVAVADDVDNNGHGYDLIQVPLIIGGWVRINMGIYIIRLCIITWMKIIICAKSESQTVLLRVHPISQSTNCIPLNCPLDVDAMGWWWRTTIHEDIAFCDFSYIVSLAMSLMGIIIISLIHILLVKRGIESVDQ